ncbi:hypothetical protein A3C57_00370 [Candidatus Nomurabacteria bacterium RIFCSPHIGHO2_02_FULL_33_12]|uniref:Cohesin domain-containing protein n=1 Tax=Candidatus Nomurabacteria bacterium RIFCSPLOWO2_01_FULL_33_17 TaxID=1801764 RepID=A0A1F6WN32_9BACT|nr:MAG: hypothetical protein A3C57_00370 [Candidatus Nomurabacteria bacterium RIFCSPHIGHO2_02_FULL_33_12]OGI83283.1 MAG: hypothetical protein A2903_02825 [Candidatus Nomurabacteria bacterium RIFCSPLOWO2_01_FULL_33_17]
MKKFLKITIFFTFFSIMPYFANASNLFFYANNNQFSRNEEFVVEVRLDTQNENINAIEGDIILLNGLNVKSINSGGSVINFWIENPSVTNQNTIHFAGLTPGGFNSNNNFLFKITLFSKTAGLKEINASGVRVLKNDGLGSAVVNTTIPISILINTKINNEIFNFFSFDDVIDDKELPESFNPKITKNPDIYNGQNVLIFTTQDKISGIDHYEVREGELGTYKNTESPYLLKNQDINQSIYIKAIDKVGNTRIEVLRPINVVQDVVKTNNYFFILLLLVIILLVIFFRKRISKFLKQ